MKNLMTESIARQPLTRLATASLCALSVTGCDMSDDQSGAAADNPPEATVEETTRMLETNNSNSAGARDYSAAPESSNDMAKFGLTELAVAGLTPRSGSEVAGNARFSPDPNTQQMLIEIELTGLEPGSLHAVHVHAVGDCSADDAASAAGHFAPYDAQHGNPDASAEHHVGDLGNVRANSNGMVEASFRSSLMAFTGPASVLQRAVIVHAGKDNFDKQPSGNAGARIACGVIQA